MSRFSQVGNSFNGESTAPLMSELIQNKNPTKAVNGNAFCGNQDFIIKSVFVADWHAIRVLPVISCVP